jgi:hypothetical protein
MIQYRSSSNGMEAKLVRVRNHLSSIRRPDCGQWATHDVIPVAFRCTNGAKVRPLSSRGAKPAVVDKAPKSVVPGISAHEHEALQRGQLIDWNTEG